MRKWMKIWKECTCWYSEYTLALRPSGVKPANLAAAVSRSIVSRLVIVPMSMKWQILRLCLRVAADGVTKRSGG